MLVRHLGLKEYEEVWKLQRKLVFERGEGAVPDTLLLCQHLPVYTIGRSSRQPIPKDLPYPVHRIERGGDLTYHGPGQLVGYPILKLSEHELKPRSYLHAVEAVLIEALRKLGVEAAVVRGFTGLWVGRKKLASIGIAVRGGIAYHGFALNMNNSLAPFRLIRPCRLESDTMTSLHKILGQPIDESLVAKTVGATFLEYFAKAALALALAFFAPYAQAAFTVPGYELVYSYPAETSLEEPDLRQAKDVWPEMIDKARRTLDINEFYVTAAAGEPLEPTLEAMERAAKRGVKIKVILEKKFERQSADAITRLKAMPGLELKIADWSAMTGAGIVHAKYFIVDSTNAFVGSQNFDWRSLKHIHEMGLAIDDAPVVTQVQSVFDHDWAIAGSTVARPDTLARTQADRSPRAYLVASPWPYDPAGVGDSQSELVRIIDEAKTEILVQNLEYIPLTYSRPPRFYPIIDNALRAAAVRGVRIKLLVSHWNTEEPAVNHLQSLALLPGIEIKVITIPESRQGPIPFARVAHSKYMVVDGHLLWIGTSNWRGGYLDQSRNLEVIVKDEKLADRAAAVQRHLWNSPYAEPLEVLKTYSMPRH